MDQKEVDRMQDETQEDLKKGWDITTDKAKDKAQDVWDNISDQDDRMKG